MDCSKHIAFISLLDTGKWGASEYLWSDAATRLVRRGYRVSASTHGHPTRPDELNTLVSDGVTLLERFPPRGARIRDFINHVWQLNRPNQMQSRAMQAIISRSPDLVLISCTWPTNRGLSTWCENLQAADIPYTILVHTHAGHNWPTGPGAIRLGQALNHAEALYFVSEDNRSLLINQLGLNPDITSVVRNPIAVDRDHNPPWPQEDVTTRMACVGRLSPDQKGQDILLECLRDPCWEDRHVTLSIFGDGPARTRLGEMASVLPEGMVTFKGHIDNPASIWETHHLLVFPSRFEGLGLAVAEAQLCGRPVVITDCAARELVIDGSTGFIATSATPSALQDALNRAWLRKSEWREMGARAREHMLRTLPADPTGIFIKDLLSHLSS